VVQDGEGAGNEPDYAILGRLGGRYGGEGEEGCHDGGGGARGRRGADGGGGTEWGRGTEWLDGDCYYCCGGERGRDRKRENYWNWWWEKEKERWKRSMRFIKFYDEFTATSRHMIIEFMRDIFIEDYSKGTVSYMIYLHDCKLSIRLFSFQSFNHKPKRQLIGNHSSCQKKY
jgi:hypothetical protein